MDPTIKNLAKVVLTLSIISISGMLGFHWIEGWSLFDSLYMAIITLTTVGFSELHPLSVPGRIFVMFYLVLGLGASLYSLAVFGEIILKAQLFNWLGGRNMVEQDKPLKDHYVVFGYGRMGKILCTQLSNASQKILVVERSEDHAAEARSQGYLTLMCDPTEQDILHQLFLPDARGMAAVFGNDADNLYVVLAARMGFPNLHITARASSKKSQQMMEKAGANQVVCPYSAGATVMTRQMVSEG